jgi:hypothetical protein
MSSLLVSLAYVAAPLSCEGVVVVVIVSSEVVPVVPFFFVAACGVSNRRVGDKLLVESVPGMGEHYNSKEMHTNQVGKFLFLYSMCPINVHYRGIYRRCFAFQVQLLL